MTRRKKDIKLILRLFITVILFHLFSIGHIKAQEESTGAGIVYNDSTVLEELNFQEDQVVGFREDSDFRYSKALASGPSLWDRMMYLLASFLQKVFYPQGGGVSIGKILVYVFCIAVVAFVILKLLGVNVAKLFYATGEKGFAQHPIEEDVHEMDFDHLISEAIKKEDFRLAVRLTYLYTLRKLSENNMIRFKMGKTNQDYCNELKDSGVKQDFENLGYYFQYVWYGHFEVDKEVFDRSHNFFDKIKNAL